MKYQQAVYHLTAQIAFLWQNNYLHRFYCWYAFLKHIKRTTSACQFTFNVDSDLFGHTTKRGEDDETSDDTSYNVHNTNQQSIPAMDICWISRYTRQ